MIELLHSWHWNPTLWPEIKGALGGVWMVLCYQHTRGYSWHRKALTMLIAYLGAPVLSVFAILFFVSERVSQLQHRKKPS